MVMVNVHEAKTNLSRLLSQVEAGEDVVIARSGKPVARLVRFQLQGKRQFGSWKGRVVLDDSFFDPLPEEELSAWEDDCCAFCWTHTHSYGGLLEVIGSQTYLAAPSGKNRTTLWSVRRRLGK